jgi:16S rRNA (guanine966-N2)-methyltransferase
MRITGGIHRSRKLETPKGNTVRPTSDKVRQAVFNMLNSRGLLQDSIVIDAFCGTGALGLEALSQGAAFCTFFDKSKESLHLCRQNIKALKEDNRTKVLLGDSTKPVQNQDESLKAGLVFMDPPYRQSLISKTVKAMFEANWLQQESVFVLEADKSENIESDLFEVEHQKIYGDTQILLAILKT